MQADQLEQLGQLEAGIAQANGTAGPQGGELQTGQVVNGGEVGMARQHQGPGRYDGVAINEHHSRVRLAIQHTCYDDGTGQDSSRGCEGRGDRLGLSAANQDRLQLGVEVGGVEGHVLSME
jgi:hypothetical protein